jgi:PiT family inorganic phosphate transporter
VMLGLMFLFANANRKTVAQKFKKLQILSAAFMATSHGLNDAQKTMGVITLALLLFHQIDSIIIPIWVTISCASAMALGTALGGWKIIKTMGHRISKLEPTNGFAAETSASLVITGASLIGAPVSTTHTITACIFGVGSAKRLSAVRWELAANLTVAWVTTIPAAGAIAAASYYLMKVMGVGE